MRANLTRIQVGQEVKLCAQKDYQEQQTDSAAIYAVYRHVPNRTQLRGESLLGQERKRFALGRKSNRMLGCAVQSWQSGVV